MIVAVDQESTLLRKSAVGMGFRMNIRDMSTEAMKGGHPKCYRCRLGGWRCLGFTFHKYNPIL